MLNSAPASFVTCDWSVFQHPVYAESRQRRLSHLLSHVPQTSVRGMRVLEAGCGTGELGAELKRLGCEVLSVDARRPYLDRILELDPEREVAEVDLEHWEPLRLGRFDAVLAFGILYHLAEPETFLEGCTRIADTIFLETIVADKESPEYQLFADGLPDGAFSGVGCRPTTAWITSAMNRYGFDVTDISAAAANWGGPFPAAYDWQPRNDGAWTRGNTMLRRMMICCRRKPSVVNGGTERFAVDADRAANPLSPSGLAPLLVHVHIPKCAGTSFQRLMRESFGTDHQDFYPGDTAYRFTRSEWQAFVETRPWMRSFSSHSLRLYPRIVADREALYVAFLRNPVERYVSHLAFFRKNFETFPPALQALLPPRCPDMEVREIAEWFLENQSASFHRGLLSVDFLAETTWVEQIASMLGLSSRWIEDGPVLSAGYESAKLALATAILDSFFFVGIVEHMDASTEILRRRLAARQVKLTAEEMPVENVSRARGQDLDWLDSSDTVGREILPQLETDMKLYRRFLARFERLAATER